MPKGISLKQIVRKIAREEVQLAIAKMLGGGVKKKRQGKAPKESKA